MFFPLNKYKGNCTYRTIEMAVKDSRKLRVHNCLFSTNQYKAPQGTRPYGTKEMAVKYFK